MTSPGPLRKPKSGLRRRAMGKVNSWAKEHPFSAGLITSAAFYFGSDLVGAILFLLSRTSTLVGGLIWRTVGLAAEDPDGLAMLSSTLMTTAVVLLILAIQGAELKPEQETARFQMSTILALTYSLMAFVASAFFALTQGKADELHRDLSRTALCLPGHEQLVHVEAASKIFSSDDFDHLQERLRRDLSVCRGDP